MSLLPVSGGGITCIRNGELLFANLSGSRKSVTTDALCIGHSSCGGLALCKHDEIVVFDDSTLFEDIHVPARWRCPIAIVIYSVFFGDRWLAVATTQTVQIYDSHSGVLSAALSLSSRARVIRLDTHNGLLVSFQEDSTIVAWDVRTWTRVCCSPGLISFARTLSVGFGAVSGGAIAVLALADSRLVAVRITSHGHGQGHATLMIPAVVPLTVLHFGSVYTIYKLLEEADSLYSSTTDSDHSGECAVGVEVLSDRIPPDCHDASVDDPVGLVAILTQRQLLIVGVSSSSELIGITVVSLDVLVDTPILARAFCFSPAGAAPARDGDVSVWSQLVVESLLDGSFTFIEIESVLQIAGKMARGAFCRSGTADSSPLAEAAPLGRLRPQNELSDCIATSPADQPSDQGASESDSESEVATEALCESVVGRAPDPSSFLLLARTPDFLTTGTTDTATSFEAQRKMSVKSGDRMRASGTMQAAPVTFHSKIRSSGYGAAPPRKPSWAKPPLSSQRRAKTAPDACFNARAASYPTGFFPRDVDEGVLPPLPVAAAARGSSVPGVSSGTQASRSLTRSQAAIPCGPVAALSFNNDGSFFAVASHTGSVHAIAVRLRERSISIAASDIECHNSGTTSPVTGINWSHTLFPGVARVLRHPPTSGRAASRGKSPHPSASVDGAESSDGGVIFAGLSAAAAAGNQQAKAAARNKVASASIAGSSLDSSVRCPLLLTCGGDRFGTVWAVGGGRPEPVFVLSSATGGSGGTTPDASGHGTAPCVVAPAAAKPSTGSASGGSSAFPGVVTSGCFFFHDKFILLSSADATYAFTFNIDTGEDALDDVSRLKRRHAGSLTRYERACWWQAAPSGASVTQVAAHNAFRSTLVFAACTDRTLRVFDAGAGGGVVELWSSGIASGAGEMGAMHTVALAPTSPFASVSHASLDCAFTAGYDSTVRLWDLRSRTCARQLSGGHTSRSHPCGIAVSPDAIYVASASEDRSVAVYDLRGGGVVARLRCATDAVTSVAWHPALAHIAAGSLDGGVRFFS